MSEISALLANEVYLGITIKQFLLAFLAILLAFGLRRLFTTVVLRIVRRLTSSTSTRIDDAIVDAAAPPLNFAFMLIGIHVAVAVLQLPDEPTALRTTAFGILHVLIAIDVAWLLVRLVDGISRFLSSLASNTDSPIDDELIPVLRKAAKTFIVIISFLFVAQNLGYSVTSLLAGLGIGGLAVALAAKDTLSNLFASIAILVDRPFGIGDWIETSEAEGVVEEIGLRSTRIRTFAKTQVSIPNSSLADATVNNYSRMPIRRVKMTIGVTYSATPQQMDDLVEGIRKLLREHDEVSQDFFLVNFTDFGASSLDVMVYYFTTTTVWIEYLRVRQEVNLQIMHLVENLGMSIAFPTRTVHLYQEDDKQVNAG